MGFWFSISFPYRKPENGGTPPRNPAPTPFSTAAAITLQTPCNDSPRPRQPAPPTTPHPLQTRQNTRKPDRREEAPPCPAGRTATKQTRETRLLPSTPRPTEQGRDASRSQQGDSKWGGTRKHARARPIASATAAICSPKRYGHRIYPHVRGAHGSPSASPPFFAASSRRPPVPTGAAPRDSCLGGAPCRSAPLRRHAGA